MKKIDLIDYKDYKQYFNFYDVIIKQVSTNKESFLESIYLSPSSYRRAKNDGNKIGKQILEELCNYFKYEMINNDIVDEIEERINQIYFNIYYKKYDSYKEDFRWLELILEKKYIIYPVVLLFKLLLSINSQNNPKNVIQDNMKIYEELQQFELFFNDDLLEIFEIIRISFVNEITNNVLANNYKNELSYYTLATKCILAERYIESIYFSEKAKNIFIREENYKRVYYANLNLMSAYNYLQKYGDCYFLAQKQLISLESQQIFEFEFSATLRHFIVSCLGLGKYNDIVNTLKDKKQLNKTELCCYLIAKYKTNKNDYNLYIDLLKRTVEIEGERCFLDSIDKFIVERNKKVINELEKTRITKPVIEILKKM